MQNPVFSSQRVFAPGVLVVQGPRWRENDGMAEQLLREPATQPFRLVCLVDDAAACVRDDASFLWTVFTRFEPAADIYGSNSQLKRYHVSMSAPVAFDCRSKPWIPPLVEPDPETVRRVEEMWSEIF